MKEKYFRLFLSTFKLSTCTFGGGFVIIPLLRKKFVEEYGWIEEQEMLDLTAIAQSAPGAIAVNAAILVGCRVAGIPGALLCMLGTVLPPLMIISVIAAFYRQFRQNAVVDMAMTGMLAGVAAVIWDVVINMASGILKQRHALPILAMGVSFVAVRFFDVNILAVLAGCGLLGVVETRQRQALHKEAFGK